MIPSLNLEELSLESRQCLERLRQYKAPPLPEYVGPITWYRADVRSFGVVRQAAVLVILFQRPGDDKLSVVLTTRAKTLRYMVQFSQFEIS